MTTPQYIKDAMKKYLQTPKGQHKRKQWLKKNKTKVQLYNINYLRQRKQTARNLGLCPTCFKRPTKLGYKQCQPCIIKRRPKK